jgi:hypothetical protein
MGIQASETKRFNLPFVATDDVKLRGSLLNRQTGAVNQAGGTDGAA